MKFLIYYPIYRDINPDISVNKKFTDIIKAFKNLGYSLDVISYKSDGIYFNDSRIKKFPENRLLARISLLTSFKVIQKKIGNNKYTLAWLRPAYITPWSFTLIKKASKLSSCTIVEYGTFPFHKEIKNYFDKIWRITDFFYTKKLKNYVKFIITYCGQDYIHGIKAINIGNGISRDEVKLLPVRYRNYISIVSVSSIYYWHGIDRIMKGLKNYYSNPANKTKVVINIVGKGEDLTNIKALVEKLDLTEYVIFHGVLMGEKLIDILSDSDIGLGSLAPHRKNILIESTLKAKEYTSKGLPIILSARDFDFPPELFFLLKVPLDETDINIEEIVSFLEDLKSNSPRYKEQIVNYSKENLTWESKIKNMVENIQSGKL